MAWGLFNQRTFAGINVIGRTGSDRKLFKAKSSCQKNSSTKFLKNKRNIPDNCMDICILCRTFIKFRKYLKIRFFDDSNQMTKLCQQSSITLTKTST